MRAYQDMVFSTAARLTGNDVQSEDIAQDVFLRAHEHFGQLRDSASAGGWLKTVTTNLTINYLTRHRRRRRLFSELSAGTEEESDTPGPDFEAPDALLADVESDERTRLIERALDHLPPHQRLVLVLYHFEEMSYQDIADRLRISLPKTKTDIRRARAAMLQILAACGISRDSV